MKKVLSVLLVLGMLLSVGFAANKSDKNNTSITISSKIAVKKNVLTSKTKDKKSVNINQTKATITLPNGTIINTTTNEVVTTDPEVV